MATGDTDQLYGSAQWNTDKIPEASTVPVMLHPVDVLDGSAIPVPDMLNDHVSQVHRAKTA
ncbi:hypothetical protein [Kibdelosporangium aridum]|nr:hypothetical protein [Kibdelosporangium aridum]